MRKYNCEKYNILKFNVFTCYNFEQINYNYVEDRRFKQVKIIFENKIVINCAYSGDNRKLNFNFDTLYAILIKIV